VPFGVLAELFPLLGGAGGAAAGVGGVAPDGGGLATLEAGGTEALVIGIVGGAGTA
jgi:hypothetical protein